MILIVSNHVLYWCQEKVLCDRDKAWVRLKPEPLLLSTAPYAECSPPISCDGGLLKHSSFPTKIKKPPPRPSVPPPPTPPKNQTPPQHSRRQLHRYHASGCYAFSL